MSIRDWPEDERPREKLLRRGPGALSTAELLALLLGNGIPGHSAVDLGRNLLQSAGGLRALLSHEPVPMAGVGPAKRARIQAALELARRGLAEELTELTTLRNPADSGEYLRAQLRDLPYEVFACLYLDNRHRVLAFEELFRGTVDSACVHPREVVRACLRHNAAAVILAHNHPSGVAEPSSTDVALTKTLKQTLALIDVRVLDHLVVGHGTPVSLSSRGLC